MDILKHPAFTAIATKAVERRINRVTCRNVPHSRMSEPGVTRLKFCHEFVDFLFKRVVPPRARQGHATRPPHRCDFAPGRQDSIGSSNWRSAPSLYRGSIGRDFPHLQTFPRGQAPHFPALFRQNLSYQDGRIVSLSEFGRTPEHRDARQTKLRLSRPPRSFDELQLIPTFSAFDVTFANPKSRIFA